jgi:hypothetical protein
MEDLKNHNWGLTLVFCLIFGVLGFISAKVSDNRGNENHKIMMHEMHGGNSGNMMKWLSDEGGNRSIQLEIGDDGKMIIDIDTTYEENGKKVRRVEKRVVKED